MNVKQANRAVRRASASVAVLEVTLIGIDLFRSRGAVVEPTKLAEVGAAIEGLQRQLASVQTVFKGLKTSTKQPA